MQPTAAQVTVVSITPFVVTANTTVVVRGRYLGFATGLQLGGQYVPFTLIDTEDFMEQVNSFFLNRSLSQHIHNMMHVHAQTRTNIHTNTHTHAHRH
jgi:hypothetical protein